MSEILTDTWSDLEMACPLVWENGYKAPAIGSFGAAERALSHPTTGDPVFSTFTFTYLDSARLIREYLASAADRYWPYALTVSMTTRANRAALGEPYRVFVGPIIDAQPTAPLQWSITLGDIVGQTVLSDQAQIPWRQIRDGPLSLLTVNSDALDIESPEPIIYGEHRRVPDVDPASPQGFIYTPTYLGIRTIDAVDWHMWMVCGHAVKDIADAYTIDDGVAGSPTAPSSILGDEGTIWLIPHHTGYDTQFGAPYEDLRSDTFGNDRRYTTIYGKVGETDPDDCVSGAKILALAILGIEDKGDSTGELITDRILQYEHFLTNYVANQGPASYQSGLWLDPPQWNVFGTLVDIVDTDSFAACSAIAELRLPVAPGSPVIPAGYIGAGIIGSHAGDRLTVRRWLAEWNRSCGVRFGVTHLGQLRVTMLHPTTLIKSAALLFTDALDIMAGSFETAVHWADQATHIPFRADFEHTTGRWITSDILSIDSAAVNYGRVITGEVREYLFAPGITAASHLARIEALQLQHPPRTVILQATVGPDENGNSLGYLDLGDYIRYRDYAGVNNSSGEIRLAQIVRHQVQVGKRTVLVEALDCEDLIDFDASPTDLGSPSAVLNETCGTAVDMGDLSVPFDLTVDTTDHATDESVSGGSPSFGGSGIAYHAAWFTMTGNIFDGVATFSCLDALFDTQMVVYSGSCGALVPQGFNDNFGVGQTSAIDIDIVGGTDYLVLVCGYGPDDGGVLPFHAVFTPNP